MREDPLVGRELGGFRVEALLRRGGMGRIYRATQKSVGNRTIALKVLAPELAEDGEFRSRFLRESLLAGGIEHPNILPVYDAGEADGHLFIAMRLVEGVDPDLGSVLKRSGALPLNRATAILAQAADALDAAHTHGLVHRDVKPGNLLLAGDHAYLTDFGIAKSTLARRELTRTGVFVGTLDYAAPEQIRNEALDPRTDIYALGCVLFQCLTGEVPFDRPSEYDVMRAHLTEAPPSISARRPDLPRSLDGVISRAMAKERDERYRSGRHFAGALRATMHPPSAAADRPTIAAARPASTEAVPPIAEQASVPARTEWAARPIWRFAGAAALLVAAVGGMNLVASLPATGPPPPSGTNSSNVTYPLPTNEPTSSQPTSILGQLTPSPVAVTPPPTQSPSQVPAPSPTAPPTPRATAAPRAAATSTPTAARTLAPAVPTSGLAIWGVVTDATTGVPIDQACVTLGPPIRCYTTTDQKGRYVIDLSAVSAPTGESWDMYFLKVGEYGQVYSGVFVVSGVVRRDASLPRVGPPTSVTAAPTPARAVGFDSAYAGESAFLVLSRGQTGTFTVFFSNTGTVSWVRGTSTQVDLVACLEDKVTCNAQDATEVAFSSGWLSLTRYATHSQSSVAPGQIGTFTYSVSVPFDAAAGTYRFNGALAVSSSGRDVHNEGYYQDVTVP